MSIYCSGCRGYNSEQDKKFTGDHILGVGDIEICIHPIFYKANRVMSDNGYWAGMITEEVIKRAFLVEILQVKTKWPEKSIAKRPWERIIYAGEEQAQRPRRELFWAWLLYTDVLRRIFTPLAIVDALLRFEHLFPQQPDCCSWWLLDECQELPLSESPSSRTVYIQWLPTGVSYTSSSLAFKHQPSLKKHPMHWLFVI